jgi:hypothetical protein
LRAIFEFGGIEVIFELAVRAEEGVG